MMEFSEPVFETKELADAWIYEARLKGWRTSEPIEAKKASGETFWWVQARRNKQEQKDNKIKKSG